MTEYATKISKLLSDYKKEKFPSLADGYYRGTPRDHILPNICGHLNLIDHYRTEFFEHDLSKKIKFHQYFHHLNSSQAMCINFFFPLFKEKKLEIILQALELDNGEKVNYQKEKVEFEKEGIDKKDGQRPTNFDFYFETESGKKLYFEIKYTEYKFGNAKMDDEHKIKYEQIYKKLANQKIKSEYNKVSVFLENYQIMRNLIHICDNSYVIFVVPKDNKPVYKQATESKDFVNEKYQNNIKILPWDVLYNIIENQNFTDDLKTHFERFMEKYKLN